MLSVSENNSGSTSPTGPLPRGEKVARWVMWAPLLAGALAVVASQRAVVWRWAHDLLDDSPDAARRSEQFARSIIGKSRKSIIRLIGSAVATARNAQGQEQWYYPVSGKERVALAITFDGDVVRSATVLRGIEPIMAVQIKAAT